MRARDVLELLFLSLLWGAAYLFMRAAVPSFGPAPMVSLRMGIGALVLLPILLSQVDLRTIRADLPVLAMLGVLFTAIPFMLLAFGARSLSAGMSAILNATSPLFTAIIAHLWLGQRITRYGAAGLVVGFTGVVVLMWGKAPLQSFVVGGVALAALAVLGASLLWGFNANYSRARLPHIHPMTQTVGSLAFGSLALLPWTIAAWPEQPPGMRAWIEVLLLGAGSTGLGTWIYFRLLGRIGAVRAISVTFLNPLTAMVSGVFYLGEAVSLQMVVGCAIILLGTALTLGLIGPRTRAAAPVVS